ncbi:hypothetical protein PCASD_15919 [Puccinia coronata f. sp. avenae]|uniref:Uncharacterized protein n=1 Tax=Puccinia coronata f. sp. avenae TaxID=200324 RepID=A0A2N5UEY5_9BASI|nr:hypothetical protein PCASD_15919 [Puccinia coronata f. sp. avenae]
MVVILVVKVDKGQAVKELGEEEEGVELDMAVELDIAVELDVALELDMAVELDKGQEEGVMELGVI